MCLQAFHMCLNIITGCLNLLNESFANSNNKNNNIRCDDITTRQLIYEYEDEQRKRHAIIQRIRRLEETAPTKKPQPPDQPPPYAELTYTEEDRKREISALRTELRHVMHRIQWKYQSIPNDAAARHFSTGPQSYNKRRWDSMDYPSAICRTSGGCCGRQCGCCEKPLEENYRLDRKTGERKLIGVYGHCTAECICCIKTYGAYDPDPRLPRPITLPGPKLL